MRCVAAFSVVLLAGIACDNAPRTVESVAGCYALSREAWQDLGSAADDTLVHNPPQRVRLLVASAATTFGRNRHRIIAPGFRPAWLPDSLAPHYVALVAENFVRYSSWALLPGDTLDIEWMDGLHGVRLRLTPHRQRWRGTARTISDQRPSPTAFATAAVTARPVPCASEEAVGSLPPPA
jgi:hypothetical protein